MATVFIAVGSNIDPYINIHDALIMLKEMVKLEAVSFFYETQPVEYTGQSLYVNGVFLVSTISSPREFKFEVLRSIEHRLGRKRTYDKCAPRTIDLDMILYDDLVMDEPDIVIPDPDIYKRAFVAIPVLELDPHLVIPGTLTQISEIANHFKYEPMRRLDDFTGLLRMELKIEPGKN